MNDKAVKPKKITLATIKSFVKKNRAHLLIKHISHCRRMIDGTAYSENPEFAPVQPSAMTWADPSCTMDIQGAWFVGGSRDYFSLLKVEGYFGYHVYNCCGSFDLAVELINDPFNKL